MRKTKKNQVCAGVKHLLVALMAEFQALISAFGMADACIFIWVLQLSFTFKTTECQQLHLGEKVYKSSLGFLYEYSFNKWEQLNQVCSMHADSI